MVNTSATGGYLQPTDTVLEGEELENFFQALIVGVTNIDSTMVRPAWQPEPTNIPDTGALWVAFRIEDEQNDNFPYLSPDGTLHLHEIFSCVCSFYGTGAGSDARKYAKILRDGLSIGQNRSALTAAGIGLIEVTPPHPLPSLVKTTWLYRVETRIRVRREIVRNYQIENVASASGTLEAQASGALIERTLTVEDK